MDTDKVTGKPQRQSNLSKRIIGNSPDPPQIRKKVPPFYIISPIEDFVRQLFVGGSNTVSQT